MADEIRVNGNLVSWSSYIFTLGTERYVGLREITYSDELEGVEPKPGMGRSHKGLGRPAGKYKVDPLKIKVFAHTAKAIRRDIQAVSSDGSLGTPELPAILQYVEAGSDDQQSTVEFVQCRLVKPGTITVAEDADAKEEELEFSIMEIIRDGVSLARPNNIV